MTEPNPCAECHVKQPCPSFLIPADCPALAVAQRAREWYANLIGPRAMTFGYDDAMRQEGMKKILEVVLGSEESARIRMQMEKEERK